MNNQNHMPWTYEQNLRDHFDVLYEEGASSGMAMSVGLHAHLSGEPFRSKYIRSFLEYASGKAGVWFATGAGMVDAYRSQLQ
jgi:hypothetical protein